MESVRGRVVNVRRRDDGSYAVTLVGDISERSYLWMLTRRPVRLGALLEFEGAKMRRFEAPGERRSSITVVEGGEMRLLADPYQRRFVPPQWLRAVADASFRRLYPHQIEGAGWAAERLAMRKGLGLFDDQGLGKTLQIACALVVSRSLPAIVVCPSSLKLSWKREIAQLRVALAVNVVEGMDGALPAAHVHILNYDLLRARERQLTAVGARAIVFDEGHILKEPRPESSHRAAVATRLSRVVGCAVVATGTPLPNRPKELWRLLHVIDPGGWPSFSEFYERYCLAPGRDEVDVGRHVITSHGRVENLDELQARMAPCVLRRLKAQVLPHLPPKKRRVVEVELSSEQMSQYNAAAKDVVAWLRKVGAAARADGAARGQAIVKIQMLRRLSSLAKLHDAVPRYLKAWFERKEPRPLVIFGYHRQVLSGVRIICTRLGLRVATITGKDPDERRQLAIDRFNAGQAEVFVAPILAAGVGLNLQAGAADALFVERVWVPTLMEQAEDRIHRLGQTKEVTITYLDAVGTVDEHISMVLSDKLQLVSQIIDDTDAAAALDRQSFDEVLGRLSGR